MKRILLFSFLLFSGLINAGEFGFIPVEIHPKLNPSLSYFLQKNKDEEDAFPIIARVSDIESWKKLSVTHFGCQVGPLEDKSWIVTANVTKKQLKNILDQSCIISVEDAKPIYPCNTTDI